MTTLLQRGLSVLTRAIKANLGEKTIFIPVVGDKRRTVYVQIDNHIVPDDHQYTEEDCDYIEVVCLRDEADADVGGIHTASRGDGILRSGEDRPFQFDGKVLHMNESFQRLVFSRPRRVTQGSG